MPIAGLAISTWHRIICLPKPSTSFMVTLSSSRSCYRHLNLCSRKVLISQPSSSKFCSLGFVKSTIFWKCNNLRFLVYRLNISKRSNLNKLCLLVRCCLPLCVYNHQWRVHSEFNDGKQKMFGGKTRRLRPGAHRTFKRPIFLKIYNCLVHLLYLMHMIL